MIKQPIPKPSGWDSWNDDQKWNYVLLFCEHLENLIQKQGGHTQGLHERLKLVESKIAAEKS
jgi:hypothetical protein